VACADARLRCSGGASVNRLMRYCAVGAIATTVHYGVLVAGVALAGWPAWICGGLGAVIGAQTAYIGNRWYTFAREARGAGTWLRFQVTAVVGASVSMAIVAAAVALGWHYLVGQVLATGLTVLLTFGINRRWTFA